MKYRIQHLQLVCILGFFIVLTFTKIAIAAPASLPELEEIEKERLHKAFVLRTSMWPQSENGTYHIPVCWEPASMAGAYLTGRQTVRRAITEQWEQYSKIRFMNWGACDTNNKGIRILVADVGPHVVALGRGLDGTKNGMVLNFKYLNWSQSCQQTINYCNYAIAVHEFGHALGFAHEQNRTDTPGECREPPQRSNGDDMTLTPWDAHSVMNYCNEKYSNDGQLSKWDKYALGRMYGDTPLDTSERFRLFLSAYRSNTPRYCDHLTDGDVRKYTVYQCGFTPQDAKDRKRLYDNAVEFDWPRPCDHLTKQDANKYNICGALSSADRFLLFLSAFESNTARYCDHLTTEDVSRYSIYQCGFTPKNRNERKKLYDNAVKFAWPRPCDHLTAQDALHYGVCQ